MLLILLLQESWNIMRIKFNLHTVINYLILVFIIAFFLSINVSAMNTDLAENYTESKHVLLICSYSPSFQSFFP